MTAHPAPGADPIKVGVIADQTGPLSVVGLANANVARMVIGDINAKGGLFGRPLELFLEDSATDDAVAAEKAAKLVEQHHVDVIFGGIYSSTRQAIKGPAVVEGKTLYIYPEQYEGRGVRPAHLLHRPGARPAGRPVHSLADARDRRARRSTCPSADYIWPHVLNRSVREVVTANGGAIVGEEYFPLDHMDYRATVERINASGADVVFNTIVPPGVSPFIEELHASGFTSRGGQLVCTYFDENFLNMVPAAQVEGLYSCLDYYQAVDDPFSQKLLEQYDALYPGDAKFTGGSGCSGLYRGLRLWAAAVTEAGSLVQEDVIAALDHASIAEGPGGPAAVVPGQHHVRMNMYIAQARGGTLRDRRDPRRHRSAGAPGARAGPHRLSRPAATHDDDTHRREELDMILATTKVDDFDQFLKIFSTKGADKRREHGSKGAQVFRDPNEGDRVWVLFDWDGPGWQSFVSDPEVPPILQEAGHRGKPQAAELGGKYDA